ncbi:MAG: VWA domain-containing protein [Pyrinomonadaceae bacterium]|nr:VWA domain-containing protein [Pyrinomonadaceae bacterium]
MSSIRKVLVISGVVFLLGTALIGFDSSSAQQMPPNPATTPTPAPPPVTTPTPPIEEDEGIINIDTEVVNVLFTAQDRKRRLLTSLQRSDVRILENGKPQEVIEFARKVDLPLSLTILIDTSASQERTLPQEKDAAKSFLESVVRPEKDEVAIVSFTGDATLEQGMTSNVARLRRAIDRVQFNPPSGYIGVGVVAGTPPVSGRNRATAGSTAIWDALWVTSEEVLGPSPDKTRRAIVLLTDGVNTYGSKKMKDAIDASLKAEAVIYSIGIGDNFYDGVNKGALRKVSENTGGKAFFPRDEGELRQAFKQIQEEMRSQYLIVYEPLNQERDGTYRKIEIEVANSQLAREKVRLTHREGYFAKSGSKNK